MGLVVGGFEGGQLLFARQTGMHKAVAGCRWVCVTPDHVPLGIAYIPIQSARQTKINVFMHLFCYLAVFAPFGLFIDFFNVFLFLFFGVFPKVHVFSICCCMFCLAT